MGKPMLYRLTSVIFEVAKWFWLSVLITFIITYVGNIAPLDRGSFVKSFSSTVLGYLFFPLPHLLVTLALATILLAVTLVAWIIVFRHQSPEPATHPTSMKVMTNTSRHNRRATLQVGEGSGSMIFLGDVNAPISFTHPPTNSPVAASSDEQLLQQYCRDISERNKNIIHTGIANSGSQALLSVSIHLDEVFIHLEAVSDRPLFDFTVERQKIQQEIAGCRGRTIEEISERYVEDFIETLSQSSDLFGQKGQGLFDFIHRTFEEYYAAMYLLNKRYNSRETLKKFVSQNYRYSLWHEPILLAVAYLNGQRDLDLQTQANELMQLILQSQDENDAILQRNLLLATLCIADCESFRVPAPFQRDLIQRLLDLYGDVLGNGRYTKLQQEIERITLLWLRGQPNSAEQLEGHAPLPVLLETWHTALCDSINAQRQEGATHLIASLAPDLGSTPKSALLALIPPLLQLADVLDIPDVPLSIRQLLPQPATFKVAEYAFIVLCLLDADGPAGWLHAQWLTWNRDNPTLLERLSQHSLELDFLLTPAALPRTESDSNWAKQEAIAKTWKPEAQLHPHPLQEQLLQASTAARYPHAFLFWQLLTYEEQQRANGLLWREVWDTFYRKRCSVVALPLIRLAYTCALYSGETIHNASRSLPTHLLQICL